jgi:hypothetical protein
VVWTMPSPCCSQLQGRWVIMASTPSRGHRGYVLGSALGVETVHRIYT